MTSRLQVTYRGYGDHATNDGSHCITHGGWHLDLVIDSWNFDKHGAQANLKSEGGKSTHAKTALMENLGYLLPQQRLFTPELSPRF